MVVPTLAKRQEILARVGITQLGDKRRVGNLRGAALFDGVNRLWCEVSRWSAVAYASERVFLPCQLKHAPSLVAELIAFPLWRGE
ncbi:hypothetical protein ACIPTZ_01755 [Pectobacterium sp. CHL-2024]|uniref:hypothetical protein n=1 Tax=Pectobacterium sp. CHL-2024 TaxID=3377079 RepID=UPI0038059AF9